MDLMVTRCCPLSPVYRQFKERRTVDISHLRHSANANDSLRALVRKFEEKDDLVDPHPEVLLRVLELERERGEDFSGGSKLAGNDDSLSLPLLHRRP